MPQEFSSDRKTDQFSSSETKTAEGQTELQQVVNLLNSGAVDEVDDKVDERLPSKDSVTSELIRKNRRLYHKNLKSLLRQINETLDEEGEGE